jgi:hypothetical protein
MARRRGGEVEEGIDLSRLYERGISSTKTPAVTTTPATTTITPTRIRFGPTHIGFGLYTRHWVLAFLLLRCGALYKIVVAKASVIATYAVTIRPVDHQQSCITENVWLARFWTN